MYNQQFPVPEHVLPHTRQFLSIKFPKKIGLGINAKSDISIIPKPIATVLSFSATHLVKKKPLSRVPSAQPSATYRTDTKKFVALPVEPTNFKTHITAKNVTNSLKQSTGQDPGMALGP